MSHSVQRHIEKENKRHRDEIANAQSEAEKESCRLKKKLETFQRAMAGERHAWQVRLNKLNTDLATANDTLYCAKRRNRDSVQKLIDTAKEKEEEIQNYIDGLTEMNE